MSTPRRVTYDDLKNLIKGTQYLRIPDTTVTVCCITLHSGFNVIGTSACIDPAAFDDQVGRDMALDEAFEQLWELEGYRLMAQQPA